MLCPSCNNNLHGPYKTGLRLMDKFKGRFFSYTDSINNVCKYDDTLVPFNYFCIVKLITGNKFSKCCHVYLTLKLFN